MAGKRLQPCGTPAGYKRHLYHKEVPCYPCSRAWADGEYLRRRVTPRPRPPTAHHTSDTDLYPLIHTLARALLGEQPGPEWDREAAMGDAF